LDETHRKIQDRIKKLSYLIGHANEQCEAKAQELNSYVQLIAATGIVDDHIILGAVLIDRAYPPEANRSDSAIVCQAALDTRRGLGVLHWDMEDYLESREQDALERDARGRFKPFEECEPLLRALLFPHVESLLSALTDEIAQVERQTGFGQQET
jgi:hypothetical protein